MTVVGERWQSDRVVYAIAALPAARPDAPGGIIAHPGHVGMDSGRIPRSFPLQDFAFMSAHVIPEALADGQKLVAFARCELVRVSATTVLAINRENGRQQMMSPAVVEGLAACTEFRTIAEHAGVLAEIRPELQNKPEIAKDVLDTLLANGMMVRAEDVVERLNGTAESGLAPSRVFVVTCDRPAAVERLLESMLSDAKLSRHESIFLVDDSRQTDSRAANRELVARFNTRSPREMGYVGVEAQQSLLEGLIARAPAAETALRFLLDSAQWSGHQTYGRARTVCLLLSVGFRAIVMDDDVLCQAVLPPGRKEGLGFDHAAAREAVFFADHIELMRAAKPAGFDPLGGHASLLGRTVGSAIDSCTSGVFLPEELYGVDASDVSSLQADARVLLTQSGAWGDPGTSSPHWVLNLDDASVAQLLARETPLVDLVESRCVGLGSPRVSLLRLPTMSQVTGLDNTALLPPYFPAFRNEDHLFGAMLMALHPQAAAVEYPWCVPHLPMEGRHYSIREPIVVTGVISLLIQHFAASVKAMDAPDPHLRLQQLAQKMRHSATRSDTDLLVDYRVAVAGDHAQKLALFAAHQRQAAHAGSTASWDAYLQRAVEEAQHSLAEPQSLLRMHGVPEGSSEQAILNRFRHYVTGFADVLEHWVTIREASVAVARKLGENGGLVP
tara:strand:+ start:3046 stop:5058 length:2013 start_codon:yes stop_codon:yes gene_type:complete